jgi:pyridoxal phosphate enzyme (YggS family)
MLSNLEIQALQQRITQQGATLVAVTKTHPISTLQQAYQAGLRIFGENKVQEMCEKQAQLPTDIQWHLIGHLQTNKVKYIAPFVQLIHSVDSWKLLEEINKRAAQNQRTIDCLLQMYIAQEETKFGLSLEEAQEILHNLLRVQLQNVKIVGLMGMASFTENKDQIRQEFKQLKQYFEVLKNTVQPEMKILSMGMSSDWQIALEEGSNMVRIGSSIFGNRKIT